MKPVTKITLHSKEEIELTEREQEIYKAGYTKADNDSFNKALILFTFIIIFFALLFIIIKKTTVEW